MSRKLITGAVSALALACAPVCPEALAVPNYNIISLGVAVQGDTASTGQGISPGGQFVTGFSSTSTVNHPLLWTQPGGTVALPNLASPARAFCTGTGVNNLGVATGTGATTFFGSSPLPLLYKNGATTALPLPGGQTLGRGNAINDSELVVGSVNGGSAEVAAQFGAGGSSVLTQTMPNGGVLRTAYGVNNAGRIVGQALDPTNAAVTKGFYLDPGSSSATDIGALTALGHNSAIAFAVATNGTIAGSSSLNSGADVHPFVYTVGGGMVEVPLPAGTTTGGGRGVNSDGWVVGTASSATAIPFLYDGIQTYRLADLIPGGNGWDLVSGTSNGAFAISDNGIITGRGLLNGVITGFVMVPVPEPTIAAAALALLPLVRRRRR